MEKWENLTAEERVQRLSQFLSILDMRVSRIEKEYRIGHIPGYEVIDISMSPEWRKDFFGQY